jgi:hypothetical protein
MILGSVEKITFLVMYVRIGYGSIRAVIADPCGCDSVSELTRKAMKKRHVCSKNPYYWKRKSYMSFFMVFLLLFVFSLYSLSLLGMRASVHVDLPGWTKEGLPALKVSH